MPLEKTYICSTAEYQSLAPSMGSYSLVFDGTFLLKEIDQSQSYDMTHILDYERCNQ